MAETLEVVFDWFWTPNFWLPKNVTWTSMIQKREQEGMFIALPRDLWAPIPLALALFVLRLLWERFVATPIGRYYGIREALPTKAAPNATLEKAYKKHGKNASHDIHVALSKQLDWDTRSVERWWRRRRTQSKASEMQRFRETSWRFLFYFSIFWYGLYILWDKQYFWDTRHCWYGYPFQEVPRSVYWYYMIELGFYFSLILSLFMDVKRKDFLEMIIHHMATITLLLFSWSDNMVRIGSLVLIVHDAVDYWMEAAKLAKYCKFHKLCDALFVVFAVVWFVTRIVLYPLRILRSTLNEGHHIVGWVPKYYLFNSLLLLIQVLDLMWFYMIVRMFWYYIVRGQTEITEECCPLLEDEPMITLILRSSVLESWQIIGPFNSHFFFNGLLLTLQVLHIIWFTMILRMAYAFLLAGKVEKDDRSDTEISASEEDETAEINSNENAKVKVTPQTNGNKANTNGTKVRDRKK